MQRRRTFFRRWLRPTFGAATEDGSAEELENEARRAEQLAVETLRAADAVDETHRAAAQRAEALGGAAASVARALRHLEDETNRARTESARLEREVADLRARADQANEEALEARLSADSAQRTPIVPEDDPAVPADAYALAHIPTPMAAAPPPPPGVAPRAGGAGPAPQRAPSGAPPPAPPPPAPSQHPERGMRPDGPGGAGLGRPTRGPRAATGEAGEDPFTEALAAATGEGPPVDPIRSENGGVPEDPLLGPRQNGSSGLNRLSAESGTPMPDALERRASDRPLAQEPVPLARFMPRSNPRDTADRSSNPDRSPPEPRRPGGGQREPERRPPSGRPPPPERDDLD